jgi:hypothetical protein
LRHEAGHRRRHPRKLGRLERAPGDSLSRYAVWQNGKFELKSFSCPVAATVEKLRALALPQPIEAELVSVLETGVV